MVPLFQASDEEEQSSSEGSTVDLGGPRDGAGSLELEFEEEEPEACFTEGERSSPRLRLYGTPRTAKGHSGVALLPTI